MTHTPKDNHYPSFPTLFQFSMIEIKSHSKTCTRSSMKAKQKMHSDEK